MTEGNVVISIEEEFAESVKRGIITIGNNLQNKTKELDICREIISLYYIKYGEIEFFDLDCVNKINQLSQDGYRFSFKKETLDDGSKNVTFILHPPKDEDEN